MPTESDGLPGKLAVVCRNVAPVRLEPDSDSEQDTQVALGQRAFVLEESGDWTRIETWDGCTGWVNGNAVTLISDGDAAYASTGAVAQVHELFAPLHCSANSDSPIITQAVFGSLVETVGQCGGWLEVRIPRGTAAVSGITHPDTLLTGQDLTLNLIQDRPIDPFQRAFVRADAVDLLDASVIPAAQEWCHSDQREESQRILNQVQDDVPDMTAPDPAALISTAMKFVGVPYLWGGTTPFGIDCSGFVQLVHRFHLYNLPRNSRTQAADPRGVRVTRDQLRSGDLVFFGNGRDPDHDAVRHVGIALCPDSFIHSAGISGVAVTTFDSPRYRDIYWGARRLRRPD